MVVSQAAVGSGAEVEEAVTKKERQALLDLIAEECGRFGAQSRYAGRGHGEMAERGYMYFAGVADGLNNVWKHLAGTELLPGPKLPYEHEQDDDL